MKLRLPLRKQTHSLFWRLTDPLFSCPGLHPGAVLMKLSSIPLVPRPTENTSDLHFFCCYSHGLQFMNDRWKLKDWGKATWRKTTTWTHLVDPSASQLTPASCSLALIGDKDNEAKRFKICVKFTRESCLFLLCKGLPVSVIYIQYKEHGGFLSKERKQRRHAQLHLGSKTRDPPISCHWWASRIERKRTRKDREAQTEISASKLVKDKQPVLVKSGSILLIDEQIDINKRKTTESKLSPSCLVDKQFCQFHLSISSAHRYKKDFMKHADTTVT